jgi:hypothetical protein
VKGLLKFCAILAVIAGMYYVRTAIVKGGIEGESLAFVKDTVGTVTLNWNRGELDRHADTALLDNIKKTGNKHPLDFTYYAQLGPRTSDLNCELGEYVNQKDETHNYVAANYSCAAAFEHGTAVIDLNILRDRDNQPWRVGYFTVTSPVFSSTTAKEKK